MQAGLMATRTAPAPRKRQRKSLHEGAIPLRAERVDRAAGIIRRVKVLGKESANGRRYLPEAIRDAVPLYEGASVRTNHPKKASDSRDVQEVFGWLENVTLDGTGEMWADLHVLNPRTDLAESVFAAAEKNPKLFGLSHNAQGDTERGADGVEVVRQIVEVRSVDLVADPATTKGLFEEVKPRMKIKLREWISGLKKLPKGGAKTLKRLIEDDYGDMEAEMPGDTMPAEEAPEPDHKEALKAGFVGAIQAVIQDCLDGEMDCKAGAKKVAEMLKAHEKLAGGEEPEPVDEGEDEDLEEDEDGKPCDKKMKESKDPKVRRLLRKDLARDLCEAANLSLAGEDGKILLESLVGAGTKERMGKIIAREQRLAKASAGPRARTQSLTESRDEIPGDVKDGKTFAQTLRRMSG